MKAHTSQYIKKCPKCGTEIEPVRSASTSTKVLAGLMSGGGVVIGATFGGPVGAVIGGVLGYVANKVTIMDIEDTHDHSQCYKYKCPNCGHSWKENIETNDNPEDPSWIGNAPY